MFVLFCTSFMWFRSRRILRFGSNISWIINKSKMNVNDIWETMYFQFINCCCAWNIKMIMMTFYLLLESFSRDLIDLYLVPPWLPPLCRFVFTGVSEPAQFPNSSSQYSLTSPPKNNYKITDTQTCKTHFSALYLILMPN